MVENAQRLPGVYGDVDPMYVDHIVTDGETWIYLFELTRKAQN